MTGRSSIDDWTHAIHTGDAASTLRDLPESSVHLAVCSPPFYQLRDYGIDGQIGLEATLGDYIQSIVDIGRELHRVLRPDGSWWLNLGDSFAGSGGPGGDWSRDTPGTSRRDADPGSVDGARDTAFNRKSKLLVPHRVAIALQDTGWIIRADAVWHKPNPTPNPVKDRLLETKEFLFHLTPNPHYFFDLDAIREPPKDESLERSVRGYQDSKLTDTDRHPDRETEAALHNFPRGVHPAGKNPGDVLEITVKAYPQAHFAVYPPELPEIPIKAACPERVCPACGTPHDRETREIPAWERNPSEIERPQLRRALERFHASDLTVDHLEAARSLGFSDAAAGKQQIGAGRNSESVEALAAEAKDVLDGYFREFTMTIQETVGWGPACECDTDDYAPGIVLDPFAGAGTTCLVAKQLGRRFIGIDLNPEYVAMAQRRVGIDVHDPTLLEDVPDDQQALAAYGGDPA